MIITSGRSYDVGCHGRRLPSGNLGSYKGALVLSSRGSNALKTDRERHVLASSGYLELGMLDDAQWSWKRLRRRTRRAARSWARVLASTWPRSGPWPRLYIALRTLSYYCEETYFLPLSPLLPFPFLPDLCPPPPLPLPEAPADRDFFGLE